MSGALYESEAEPLGIWYMLCRPHDTMTVTVPDVFCPYTSRSEFDGRLETAPAVIKTSSIMLV